MLNALVSQGKKKEEKNGKGDNEVGHVKSSGKPPYLTFPYLKKGLNSFGPAKKKKGKKKKKKGGEDKRTRER